MRVPLQRVRNGMPAGEERFRLVLAASSGSSRTLVMRIGCPRLKVPGHQTDFIGPMKLIVLV